MSGARLFSTYAAAGFDEKTRSSRSRRRIRQPQQNSTTEELTLSLTIGIEVYSSQAAFPIREIIPFWAAVPHDNPLPIIRSLLSRAIRLKRS